MRGLFIFMVAFMVIHAVLCQHNEGPRKRRIRKKIVKLDVRTTYQIMKIAKSVFLKCAAFPPLHEEVSAAARVTKGKAAQR